MDGYSEDRSEFAAAANDIASSDVGSIIGTDERRMHVRAYNYWCSLCDGKDFPAIADLDPGAIEDFGPHSVIVDLSGKLDQPKTPYVGSAIRDEIGVAVVNSIADVPGRSLLSRLTDHYFQIIATRAPVGFEAEFVNQRGEDVCYRGILMPFSSDGETVDFVYGVISWKIKDTSDRSPATLRAALPPINAAHEDEQEIIDQMLVEEAAHEAHGERRQKAMALTDESDPAPSIPELDLAIEGAEHHEHLTWEDGPLAEVEAAPALPPATVEPDAGLADRLCAARECAEVCKAADGRSRAALYRALALAYDFAVAAKRVPGDYAEILDDAGVKAQARAPMTPIVKLVFGADYDKTRLTEFASALSNAERNAVDFGGFEHFLGAADGGLKGLVAAERLARRPADAPVQDKSEAGRIRLRGLAPIRLQDLPTNQEFALVMVRRNHAGHFEPVALVDDPATLEKTLRRFA